MEQKFTETYTIDLEYIGEVDCMVTGVYTREVPAIGEYGPPEDYDPGCSSELYVTSITCDGIEITGGISSKQMDEIEEALLTKFDSQDFDQDEF